MDPVLAQSLSGLVAAIATAILMAAAHYWGPNQRQYRHDEREHHDEWAEEDDVRRRSRHAQDSERDYSRRHRGDVEDHVSDEERDAQDREREYRRRGESDI